MSDTGGQAEFVTTLWSEVFRAGDEDQSQGAVALEALCQKYWPPLYLFVRKSGFAAPDAEDITQAFFLRLVEKKFHLAADQERGRFRTFLLGSMKNFVSNWRRDAWRLKRGGGAEMVSLDLEDAEQLVADELKSSDDPEVTFHRNWAHRLLELAGRRVAGAFERAGQTDRHEALRACLENPEELPPYPELAERLGISESAVRSAVARMREQFREYYRDEVAQVVMSREEVDQEIKALMNSF